MLPAAANRSQAAVVSLQAFTAMREKQAREDKSSLVPGLRPAGLEPPAPRDMKAINEYYFGNHLTATEAMARLFETLVDTLNEKLELGRSDDPAARAEGDAWRERMLLDASAGDFTLPKPGTDGISFRDVSALLASKFDLDALSLDSGIKKVLERAIGFKLDGMSAGDLVEAFLDPKSEGAGKVRATVSEGLAGTEGSKASERMKDAVDGPETAEEAVRDIAVRTGREEVDAESLAEDEEKLAAAKTRDRLSAVLESQERLNDLFASDQNGEAGMPAKRAAAVIASLAVLAANAEGEPKDDASLVAPANASAVDFQAEPSSGTGNDPNEDSKAETVRAVVARERQEAVERRYLLADTSRDEDAA